MYKVQTDYLAIAEIRHYILTTVSYTSHAHTVVWECCKDDRQSQWGMVKFDPQPTLNPWTARHQIWNTWLRRDSFFRKKFGLNLPRGFWPPYTRIIHWKPSSVYFTFFSPSEPLQRRPLDRFSRLIRHTTWFCARKCLLLVRKINFKIWPIYSKNSKKILRRLWGNFDKIVKCHNSGYMQDEVIIFDSSVGFSGTAYLRASFKFTPRITPVAMATKFGTKSAITLAM